MYLISWCICNVYDGIYTYIFLRYSRFAIFYYFRCMTWWFKIFTDYTTLIVIIRYWLYTLCCTIYPCMLVHAKLLQPCQILCNPIDQSPPGSSVHGILQARILEWVAMPSSRDLPDPGLEPTSLHLLHWQAGSLPLAPSRKPTLYSYSLFI